jgi:hypothetical protein
LAASAKKYFFLLFLLIPFYATMGSITVTSVDLESNQAGDYTLWTFTYSSSGVAVHLPDSGKIAIWYPKLAGLDLSNIMIASSRDHSKLNGGFSKVEVLTLTNYFVVVLTRDGTGDPVLQNVSDIKISIGLVGNPLSTIFANQIRIETYDKGKNPGTADIPIEGGYVQFPINIVSGDIVDSFDLVDLPTSVTAGQPFTVSVQNVQDSEGDPVSGSLIYLSFNDAGDHDAPDGTAPVLRPIVVRNGTGSSNSVLYKSGETIQLKAESENNVTDISTSTTVLPAGLGGFELSGYPAKILKGNTFPNDVTVKAYDSYKNEKTDYSGTITFTGSDPSAQLPSSGLTFAGFSKVFSGSLFAFNTTGTHSFTVTDAGIQAQSDDIQVNSLLVWEIRCEADKVGQSQQDVRVLMDVRNLGSKPFTLTAQSLFFRDYLNPSISLDTDFQESYLNNITEIQAGETATLEFNVDVLNPSPGSQVSISGKVYGVVDGLNTESDHTEFPFNYWTVYGEAELVIDSVAVIPDEIFQGQSNKKIELTVEHTGQSGTSAAARISTDPDFNPFILKDANDEFILDGSFVISRDPFNNTSIISAADDKIVLDYLISATNTAQVGKIYVYASLPYTDVITGETKYASSTTAVDSFVVRKTTTIQIADISPSQSQVTRNQLRQWNVQVAVENTGNADIDINLDSSKTFLEFRNGVVIDTSFHYTTPDTLEEGGTLIPQGETRHIVYSVTKTGSIVGTALILATVETVHGLSTNSYISQQVGAVEVQKEANVYISDIIASQSTVTVPDSSYEWSVKVVVSNASDSKVELDFVNSLLTQSVPGFFQTTNPEKFTTLDSTLIQGESDTLNYIIKGKTDSTETGDFFFGAVVTFRVLNTGEIKGVTASDQQRAHIVRQAPAELDIPKTRASRLYVTRGVTPNWWVTVYVMNNGGADLRLNPDSTVTFIEFFDNDDQPQNISFQTPSTFASGDTLLRAASSDSLIFSILSLPQDTSKELEIYSRVQMTEMNRELAIHDSLESTDDVGQLIAQSRADIVFDQAAGGIQPGYVAPGSFVKFRVAVQNSGESTITLSPTETILRLLGTNFAVNLDPGSETELSAGESRELTFNANYISEDIDHSTYTPRITFVGEENSNHYSKTLDLTSQVTIGETGEIAINYINPEMPTLTLGREESWDVFVGIKNNAQSAFSLDSVDVQFFSGKTRITDFFDFGVQPLFSDTTDSIGGNRAKEIIITVNSFSQNTPTGTITISATVWLTDLIQTTRQIKLESDVGTAGYFTVKSPAKFEILNLFSNQSKVTRGQTSPWRIGAQIRNSGGSDLRFVSHSDSSYLTFDKGNQYFTVQSPPEDVMLPSGKTDSVYFTIQRVDTSAVLLGENSLATTLSAVEENSGKLYQLYDLANGSPAELSFIVQDTARVRVDSLIAEVPFDTLVNVDQEFYLKARITNLGNGEVVETTTLRFFPDAENLFAIVDPYFSIDSLAAGESKWTEPGVLVTAPDIAVISKRLSVGISEAISRNTKQSVSLDPNMLVADTTVSLTAQIPAELSIDSLTTSIDTLSAGSLEPWTISVYVSNLGEAPCILLPPRAQNIHLPLGYVVEPPVLDEPERLIFSNEQRQLDYTVKVTGFGGGEVTILSRLAAMDGNDVSRDTLYAEEQTTAYAEKTSRVRLLSTFIESDTLYLDGADTAHVNIAQSFNVLTTVTNDGGIQRMDSVWIRLRVDNSKLLSPDTLVLTNIDPGDSKTALFECKADSQENLNGETITAKIFRAITRDGSLADIKTAGDSTAVVKIYRPAKLQISDTGNQALNEPFVSVGQTFPININITNLNSEPAEDIRVRLFAEPGNAVSIVDTILDIEKMAFQGKTVSDTFWIEALAQTGNVDFYSSIVQAFGRNDLKPVTDIDTLDNSTSVTIQQGAQLQITNVIPAIDLVNAGDSRNPWTLAVVVRNTGQADMLMQDISPNNIVIQVGDQVDPDYSIRAPSGLKIANSWRLRGGNTDTLVYEIRENGKIAGEADVLVSLSAYDRNKGSQSPALTANGQTSVTVTSQAWVRIDRMLVHNQLQNEDYVDAVVGNNGDFLTNRDQKFQVHVICETGELAGVDSIVVELFESGSSETQLDTIARIPTEDKASAVFSFDADGSWNKDLGQITRRFSAQILSANSLASTLPAIIRGPETSADTTLSMRIQMPAQLSVQLFLASTEDTTLSSAQEFSIVAGVTNLGTSPMTAGEVRLQPPDNYYIQTATDSVNIPVVRSFQLTDGVYSVDIPYYVYAPVEESLNDRFECVINTYPNDVNTQQAVIVDSQRDTVTVSTFSTDLNIASFTILSPEGAKDGILSTGQNFTVQARIHASENLANVTASLLLPSAFDYELLDAQTRPVQRNQDMTWKIKTPSTAVAIPHDLTLQVDANTLEGTATERDSITISRVVKRTSLYLEDLKVVDPSGVMQNETAIFSKGQSAVLRTVVKNFGDADINGTGIVRLDLKDDKTGLSLADAQANLEKEFQIDEDLYWSIKAPTFSSPLTEISVEITEVPLDENTGLTAGTQNTPNRLRVKTEKKGSIQITGFGISYPGGAKDGVVSTGQMFKVSAQIDSDIDKITERLRARIFFDPAGVFDAVEQVIDVEPGFQENIEWSIIAPEYKSSSPYRLWFEITGIDKRSGEEIVTSSETIDVSVEDKTMFSLKPTISQPVGLEGIVSTGQQFTIKIEIEHDGADYFQDDEFRVQMERPKNALYQMDPLDTSIKEFVGSAFWTFTAPESRPEGLSEFKFTFLSVPRDQNTGKQAAVRNNEWPFTIQTVEKTKLELNAYLNGANRSDSGVVRVGSKFHIVAELENKGEADFEGPYQVSLHLPQSGFRVDEAIKSGTGPEISWEVQAPTTLLDSPDTFYIKLDKKPNDKYARKEATVLKDSAEVIVGTKTGTVSVTQRSLSRSNALAKGQENITVMGLVFRNSDLISQAKSVLKGISLIFRNKHNEPIRASSVISRISAIKRSLPQKELFSTTIISEEPEQFLDFTLGSPDTISGSKADSIDIVVNISANASVTDFHVDLDSSSALLLYDAESNYPLTVGDMDGNYIQFLGITSGTSVVVDSELEESFYNYPNPFGSSGRRSTKLVYFLKQPSDVEIKIFTLTGEPVRSWSFTKEEHYRYTHQGIHDGDVTWNGTNGNGFLVLNGIYVAYITAVDYNETTRTNIAVVK